MKKHRLSSLQEDVEFVAFGLSCHAKDFTVAWHLNNAFGLALARHGSDDITLYKYTNLQLKQQFTLVSNQQGEIQLIKLRDGFNLFLLVSGYLDIFDRSSFFEKLRTMEVIQSAAVIDPELLRRHQNVLFDENF